MRCAAGMARERFVLVGKSPGWNSVLKKKHPLPLRVRGGTRIDRRSNFCPAVQISRLLTLEIGRVAPVSLVHRSGRGAGRGGGLDGRELGRGGGAAEREEVDRDGVARGAGRGGAPGACARLDPDRGPAWSAEGAAWRLGDAGEGIAAASRVDGVVRAVDLLETDRTDVGRGGGVALGVARVEASGPSRCALRGEEAVLAGGGIFTARRGCAETVPVGGGEGGATSGRAGGTRRGASLDDCPGAGRDAGGGALSGAIERGRGGVVEGGVLGGGTDGRSTCGGRSLGTIRREGGGVSGRVEGGRAGGATWGGRVPGRSIRFGGGGVGRGLW